MVYGNTYNSFGSLKHWIIYRSNLHISKKIVDFGFLINQNKFFVMATKIVIVY